MKLFKRNKTHPAAFLYDDGRGKRCDMFHYINHIDKGDFQNVMKIPLLMAQCLGLLPVAGLQGNDVSKVRFNLVSAKFVYSFISCVNTGIVFVICCYRLFIFSITYGLLAYVVFFGAVFCTVIMFLRIARRWSFLVREISILESMNPATDSSVKSRVNFWCIAIMSLATLEHILSIIAKYAEILDCYSEKSDIYEAYIRLNFPILSDLNIPYSVPTALVSQMTILSTTLIWNYSDMFIICVSLYLTSRFDQVNAQIFASRGLYLPSSFWRRVREDYTNVSALVALVDDVINGLIFVATASNMFFICMQLFNSLANGVSHRVDVSLCPNYPSGPFGGKEHAIYFVYSLAFLVWRSLAVSLAAARVHASSLAPAPALHEVPSPAYCVEVERLLHQLQGGHVALTGLKFYKITRTLILSVAGSIITYELVLLQFDG